MQTERETPNDTLTRDISDALDRVEKCLARLPESHAKAECFDLLMRLRFKTKQVREEPAQKGAKPM